MTDLTTEKRAELRRLAAAVDRANQSGSGDDWRGAIRLMQSQLSTATVLSLLDALDAGEAAMAELKSKLRKFVPSARDDRYCRNCEEPHHEHYSGPFAEPGTAYCSKYFVPMGPR